MKLSPQNRRPGAILFGLLKETAVQWQKNNIPMMSAALSFYMLFSLGPLLVVMIFAAGLLFQSADVEGKLMGAVQPVVGPSGAALVDGLIKSYSLIQKNILLNIVGVFVLFISAGNVFGHLQYALDIVWGVEPKKPKLTPATKKRLFPSSVKNGEEWIFSFLKRRLLPFVLIVVLGFMFLASIIIQSMIIMVADIIATVTPVTPAMINMIYMLFSFSVMVAVFAAVYKLLPERRIPWRNVWLGAVVTSLLLFAGQMLVGMYLWHWGDSLMNSVYGATGSFIIAMLWIYYCAQVVLFGAQFTKVYAQHKGDI